MGIALLPPGQVHLWFVFEDEIHDDRHLAEYRELLTVEERERERKFHFAHDRQRYLVTRALIRTVLSHYAARPPRDWRFAANAYGRPVLVNGGAPMEDVSFNLAHSNGAVMCGIARDVVVGVDVEDTGRQVAYRELAERVFSPPELAAYQSLPSSQQRSRFFHLWSLKESFVKSKGLGLTIPLASTGFEFRRAQPDEIIFRTFTAEENADCQFWLMQPSSSHVAAVCAGLPRPSRLTLHCWKTVPLIMHEVFRCTQIAHSVPSESATDEF